MNTVSDLVERFRSRFGTGCDVYCAPGRVNLIGEHTDYNGGFVLPAAIAFFTWVGIHAREDRKLAIYSENFDEVIEASLGALPERGAGRWSDYCLGVARVLECAGKRLSGANLYIRGDIPLGAGLGSSAAVEVATAYALLKVAGHPVDLCELAQFSQKAENEFVGARCGIMDQFISCCGRAGHALLLDCHSLEFEYVRIPPQVHLVICNTMVKHHLDTGEYNVRRAECEEALRRLQDALPEIQSLRDVTLADLERQRERLGGTLHKRCRHVITENHRTRQLASALSAGNLGPIGDLFAASHRSLREDYEVSCPELDLMVEIAGHLPGLRGARMTGGGFGGCTINLVDIAHSRGFCHVMAEQYAAKTGLRPDIYVSEASHGVQSGADDFEKTEVSARARNG